MSQKAHTKPEGWTDEEWENWEAYKAHIKGTQNKGGSLKYLWLKDAIGRKVEVSCTRSPKVMGVVKAIDQRYGRVLIENDEEMVELSMSDIAQVRYPK